MYLSRLMPDMRSRDARRDLANPYEMHRTLSHSVERGIDEGVERVLWRLELDRHGDVDHVLVQTVTEPDWGFLPDPYLQQAPESKRFEVPSVVGMPFRFRLRANPSVRREGKRHALNDPDAQRDWLERKAARAGFRLVRATLASEERMRAHKDGRTLTVFAVTFEGAGRVADSEPFAAALRSGIGPAKSLGLGLLSVAPV